MNITPIFVHYTFFFVCTLIVSAAKWQAEYRREAAAIVISTVMESNLLNVARGIYHTRMCSQAYFATTILRAA